MAATEDAARVTDSVASATHDLYQQYGKQIYAYCLHQLRSREEAEDAVQTTFLNAFRGLQRGTTTRFEQAWLYKIAANVCIARRSSSGRRLRLEAPDDFEMLEEIVPSGSASAGDTLELMGLDEALEQMPENQRRAILLREWQGLSYREIASELELSQGAVEMLIFRARRTLASALEEPAAPRSRAGKAKTGFSFGSLIAALKGLFSAGVAAKMAAVAVSVAVVGTGAVHSVVHSAMSQRHAQVAAKATQVDGTSSTRAFSRTSPVALVSYRAPRAGLAATRVRVARTAGADAQTGPRPVPTDDVAPPPAPARPAATDEPSMSVTVPVSAPAPAVTPTPAVSSPPQQPAEPGASSAGSTDNGGKTNDRDRTETGSSTGSTATATPDSRDASTSSDPTTTTTDTTAAIPAPTPAPTTATTTTTTTTTTDASTPATTTTTTTTPTTTTTTTTTTTSGATGNGPVGSKGGGGHRDHAR